jgi:hypothetical protein
LVEYFQIIIHCQLSLISIKHITFSPFIITIAAIRGLTYSRRWIVLTAALFCAVLLAGCLSGPILSDQGQEGPVSVNLTNAADQSYEFRVVVAKRTLYNDEVIVREKTGESSSVSPGQGSSTYGFSRPGENSSTVSAVELPSNISFAHSEVTLQPGESVHSNIDEFETGWTVLVIVSRQDRVLWMYTVSCGNGDLVGLEVTMTPNGTSSGRYCR